MVEDRFGVTVPPLPHAEPQVPLRVLLSSIRTEFRCHGVPPGPRAVVLIASGEATYNGLPVPQPEGLAIT